MIRMPFAEGPWWNRLRLQVQKKQKKSTPRTHMEIKKNQKQKIHHHASDIFSNRLFPGSEKSSFFGTRKGWESGTKLPNDGHAPSIKHVSTVRFGRSQKWWNQKLSHEYSILNFFDLFHFAWKWSTCTTSIWFKNFHTQLTITHCWLNVPVCFT